MVGLADKNSNYNGHIKHEENMNLKRWNLKNGEFYIDLQTIREIEVHILLMVKLRTH